MLPPHFLTIPQIQHERHAGSKLIHLTILLEYLLRLYDPNVIAAELGKEPKVGERVIACQQVFSNFKRVLSALRVRNSFAHVMNDAEYTERDHQNAVDSLVEAIGDVCRLSAIPRALVQAIYQDPDADFHARQEKETRDRKSLHPYFFTIPQIQHERHVGSKLFHLTTLLEYLLKLYNPNLVSADGFRDPNVGARVIASQQVFSDFEMVLWSLKVRNSFAHAIEGSGFNERDQQKAVDFLIEAIGKVCEQPEIPRDIVHAIYYDSDADLRRKQNEERQNRQAQLTIFLCHSSGDKAAVRDLYYRLRADGFNPWLDEENLLPGQDWSSEIRKALRESHIVVVCLSRQSINKKGFVQNEIRLALDVADEQPEDIIFIVPARLEECQVPQRLSRWHWVDLFSSNGYERLTLSLKKRNSGLKDR